MIGNPQHNLVSPPSLALTKQGVRAWALAVLVLALSQAITIKPF